MVLYRRKLMFSLLLCAASAAAGPLVNVVTFGGQFGVVNPNTGAFTQIGPITADPILGLVNGPNGSVMGVSFGGNLESIDPATGLVSVVGATGLGSSLATAPFATGELNATVYETDGSNNFYSIDTATGAATWIGATGLPECPSVTDPNGLGDEAFFAYGGNLYLTFDGYDFVTNTVIDNPELYRINTTTGAATWVGPTAFGIDAAVQVGGTVYAFTGFNTVLSLNPADGSTSFVTNYDPSAIVITGAAATPEPVSLATAGLGIAFLLGCLRRRREA